MWLKINSGYSRTWKYPSASTKEGNSLRCQFTVKFLCFTVRPWDLSENCVLHQNRETWQMGLYIEFTLKREFYLNWWSFNWVKKVLNSWANKCQCHHGLQKPNGSGEINIKVFQVLGAIGAFTSSLKISMAVDCTYGDK